MSRAVVGSMGIGGQIETRDGDENMLKDMDTWKLVQRLLKAAGMRDGYPDGMIIRDIGSGYCADMSGYRYNEFWAMGDWNDNNRFDPETGKHVGRTGTKVDTIPSRLARALEFVGVELFWSDEHDTCAECHRLMRTQADSYSWTLEGAWTDDGYVCAECMSENVESYLEDYLNDPERAITWCGAKELKAAGFVKWEPGNEQDYETGWHPGQDDDPKAVLAEITQAHNGDVPDVVFLIDGVGQFDCNWSAWVRVDEEGE